VRSRTGCPARVEIQLWIDVAVDRLAGYPATNWRPHTSCWERVLALELPELAGMSPQDRRKQRVPLCLLRLSVLRTGMSTRLVWWCDAGQVAIKGFHATVERRWLCFHVLDTRLDLSGVAVQGGYLMGVPFMT